MGANEPGQMHELFAKFFNSKDIDGLISLYEPHATLASAPGSQREAPKRSARR